MSSGRVGSTLRRAAVILGLGLAAAAFSADTPPVSSGAAREGWGQLNLRETTLGGTKVFYEKALEPNLPVGDKGADGPK